MEMEEIARWVYIAFIVIAIVAGLALGYQAATAPSHWADPTFQEYDGWVTLLMFIFGIIIALAGSITAKEIGPFLLATIALLVVGVGNVWSPLAQVEVLSGIYYVATVMTRYIAALAAPIAVIIAIRQIHAMAKEK